MGSSNLNSSVRTEKMVTMKTDLLKDRLNRVYNRAHKGDDKALAQDGLFEYLWDLKEVALLEGKTSVELPKNWLDELEQVDEQVETSRLH